MTKPHLAVVLAGLAVCVISVISVEDSCYRDVITWCHHKDDGLARGDSCDAKYGGADSVFTELQKYAHRHLAQSHEYLLMSAHHGNYENSRAGFARLFQRLSDAAWKDAVDLIVYVTKRGGRMDFDKRDRVKDWLVEDGELASLARALDMQKALAEEAHSIHRRAVGGNPARNDPEVSAFLERRFIGSQAESVYQLSAYLNDLKHLLEDGGQAPLALYVFDEYLQNQMW